ncbi:phosphatase PAP2 family protein [Dermatobacter hominis]|uniref:phosphatase PAP2 family protein n=1 Tax=Dermatobacter hominis TaxID=2884263 RepID=UPI001D12EA59|nr:phosphatase PAP2 family protein [Dermatobacter hominis]UDY36967.1 phosphatase PAP2 family protein [Dermatobacter hominis]
MLVLDRTVDAVAARLRGHAAADRALYALSQAANHSLLWHGINAVDAVVGGPAGRRRALRRSVVLVAEQAAVNGPIKTLFRRTRPDHVTDHPHGLRTPLTSSFPSGHASAGACAATLLTADLGAAPLWWGLAAAVAWSRVHVGAHHATDLVGGAVVGSALGRVAGVAWPAPGRRA